MHACTHNDIHIPEPLLSCLQHCFGESTGDTKSPSICQNVHCTEQHLFFMYYYNLLSACQLNRTRNSGGKLMVRANRALKHFHGNSPSRQKG